MRRPIVRNRSNFIRVREGPIALTPASGAPESAGADVMRGKARRRTAMTAAARAFAVMTAAYAVYASLAWLRYGHPSRASGTDADPLLDHFVPAYDVAERHHIHVQAPAAVTLAAACQIDLQQSSAIRAIFRAREVLLGSALETTPRPRGLMALTRSLGRGVIADVPGNEIVMGAVTQPWKANVVFRPLPPSDFATFNEPGYVKIAWTLRADPVNGRESIFRSETRAIATDRTARAKFRRYWSLLSPGIIAIRWTMLRPVKYEAERRCARAVDLAFARHRFFGDITGVQETMRWQPRPVRPVGTAAP
jgi:hypothetical protein